MHYPAEMPVLPPHQVPQPAPAGPGQASRLLTIGQLIVSTIGLAFFSLGFIGLVLSALVSMGSAGDISQSTTLFAMAWTAAVAALLMVPSMVYAILRLLVKPNDANPFKNSGRFVTLALLLFPIVLVVGALLTAGNGTGLLLASPLHLLAVGIPLWVFFEMSTRGLKRGSPQRGWGVLSFGMTVTPVVTLLAELVLLVMVIAAVIFWAIKTDPANLLVLNRLQMRLMYGGLNTELLQRLIQTYINQPLVFYTTLAIFSGFIPLVEETLKPLALWFLIKRRLSPTEGFTAGLISGLAFSVIESSNAMAMSTSSAWAVVAIGRLGAGLLHMTTAGLMGWALASAFNEGRYFRLVFSFLLAITLHGLWNGLTLLTVVGPLLSGDGFLQSLGQVAPIGLTLLMGALFFILLGWNHILRRSAAGG
jgi:hypothetical protein